MTVIDLDPDVYQALVSSREDHNTLLRHLLGAAGLMKASTKKPYRKKKTGKWSLHLRGQEFVVESVREGFRTAISKLEAEKPGLLEELSKYRTPIAGRRIVSRTREDVYPNSPHLTRHAVPLNPENPEWYFDGNISEGTCNRYLERAALIAGIKPAPWVAGGRGGLS